MIIIKAWLLTITISYGFGGYAVGQLPTLDECKRLAVIELTGLRGATSRCDQYDMIVAVAPGTPGSTTKYLTE